MAYIWKITLMNLLINSIYLKDYTYESCPTESSAEDFVIH